jgi:hypothetical protein
MKPAPVPSALAARVSEIHAHNMPMSTPLSYVQPGTHVQSHHTLHAVRHGTRVAKLEQCGYNLSRIGSHSLRVSGAMALWLSSHSAEAIMKMGHWRTNTFLTYIHSQIASLCWELSKRARMHVQTKTHGSGGHYQPYVVKTSNPRQFPLTLLFDNLVDNSSYKRTQLS